MSTMSRPFGDPDLSAFLQKFERAIDEFLNGCAPSPELPPFSTRPKASVGEYVGCRPERFRGIQATDGDVDALGVARVAAHEM